VIFRQGLLFPALPFLTGNLKTSAADCADWLKKIGENPRNPWQRIERVFLFPVETGKP